MDQAQQWVEQARQGDRHAFRRLVEAQARPLFTLCARITRDAALAEDAVQEALFNAWKHLRDFDGRASFTTWLHRIAVNAALEQLRRRNQREVATTDLGDDEDDGDFLDTRVDAGPGPEHHARSGEIAQRVRAQLERMTVLERSAFVLRHHEGRSMEEISSALSLNISACKQAVFRAVRKLRGALEPLR
ncbi:MAG: RNA polymerase sigma factor [Tahibacter sp.]